MKNKIQTNESANNGKLINTYEGVKLYRYGSLNVVELHGNYKEMGRQYGALRKDVLNGIYLKLSKDQSWLSSLQLEDIYSAEQQSIQIYEIYPNFNEIMHGIAETSGLGNTTYIVASILKEFYILNKTMKNAQSQDQCSFNAAWEPYTLNFH